MSLVNMSRMSLDAVALLGHPVDAEAEREPAPLLRVEPAGAQHVRVDHPAPAELDPVTVRALDVELRRRLGEREVARPQARREAGPEERLRERLDRSGQVGHRDVAVDDESFDLVEHGHVRGVGRVAPEHPPRRDDVDRRLGGEHRADLHRRRVGAQQRGAGLPSGVTWSTNSVSNSPRAGCPSPMLSASKLCQSVSTSGPSAIWKPSPMNMSSSRSQACVTRCA